MISFAVYNLKGGVGKTTATANLAYLCAQEGFRTLIWDLDPQGAVSFYFRIRAKIRGSGRKIVRGRLDPGELAVETDFESLDLIPADRSYRKLDLAIAESGDRPATIVQHILKHLRADYDVVFLDCAPGLSILSEGIMGASDHILIPLIPTTLSLRSLDQVFQFAEDRAIPRSRFLPFFNMVDRRKTLHRASLKSGIAMLNVLPTWIPASSAIERMGPARRPVGSFAPRSDGAIAYAKLWSAIRSRSLDSRPARKA